MAANPILGVANTGTSLVTATTKYMSTLPQQIEVVEELVSVSAVTSSLLTSLYAAIARFPQLGLSPTSSFIAPLCADILRAFSELEMKVEDAKTMKIFEKNEVGLVRTPRFAWFAICGGEKEAARLRSRLYVEKYRVRVLVDAITWEGLRQRRPLMPFGRFPPEMENEYVVLRNMLPLLAERLVGVQKDYTPRLKGESAPKVVAAVAPKSIEVAKKKEEVVVERDFDMDLKKSSKLSIHSMSSSTTFASISSAASSVTAINETHHEVWLLRRNEVKRTLHRRLHVFGVPYWTSYDFEPASYYVKAIPSCHDEVTSYLATSSPLSVIRKQILKMDEDAQWEIQKLCEAREKASNGENVKRSFDVVAFHERPRRKISAQKKWWKSGKNQRVEWVIVLRGETVDRRSRVTPVKHEDPWNPKPKPMPVVASPPPPQSQPQQIICPMHMQAHVAANAVKRVPDRKQLTIEEAEVKMGEILRDLFNAQVAQG